MAFINSSSSIFFAIVLGKRTSSINFVSRFKIGYLPSPIDNKKYPAVELAKICGRAGGGLPAIYNAANEVAVAAFLASQIKI